MSEDKPRVDIPRPDAPGPESEPARFGLWRLNRTSLGIAVILAALSGVYAYLEDMPLEVSEELFLLVLFYAGVQAVRWAWSRSRGAGGEGR